MAIIIDLLPSLTILYKYTTNVNQIRSSRFLDDESRLVKDRTAEKEEAAKAEDLNKTRPIEKKQESRTCWTWHWNPWTKYYFRGIKTITTLPKIFYISFVIFIKWHLPNTLFRYLYPYKRGWWKVKEYQLCFFRCDKLISSPKDKSIPIHLQRVCWYRRTRRRNYWMEGLF